jgi:hypothetical protein
VVAPAPDRVEIGLARTGRISLSAITAMAGKGTDIGPVLPGRRYEVLGG